MSESQRPNRLIHETSPYLRQHAHNPVDWYPWGEEAITAARAQQKPVFLSIGYSACHWCHVMERESFESSGTAALMNEHFINIKVDREERPDLDQIYMASVQMMTGRGGWPMSVWLTPDMKPFYAGTYFPPEPRHGMPSFRDVLAGVVRAWTDKRDQIDEASEQITAQVQTLGVVEKTPGEISGDLIAAGARELARMVDRQWGGFGQAPKFPHTVELRLMFRGHALTGSDELRDLALRSLDMMIRGGIYDQLGGGFHRYSTDQQWLVPHFEKMLYDNALVPLACLEAYQLTGNNFYADAVSETLDFVLREMTAPEGGFYSTLDADSEGVEGKFFVWSRSEIKELLGEADAETFCYCYDVTDEGNWEKANILNRPKTHEQAARILETSTEELEATLAKCRQRLFQARAKRVRPGMDDKILTSWNAMMIDTFAVASSVLAEDRYRDAARRAAEFLLQAMRTPDGLLRRTYKDGAAKLNAYLEDYAYLANALVSLYEATFDPAWLDCALEIVEPMIDQFWDQADGAFFYTGKDHEPLIARGKDPHDGAIPSGNAVAVTALARLAKLTGRAEITEKVDATLALFRSVMTRSAMASAQMLIGLGVHLGPTHEFVVAGDPDDSETRDILRAIYRRFVPNKVVALRRPADSDDDLANIPLLAEKHANSGAPTLFICHDFTCQEPLTGRDAIQNAMAHAASAPSIP